MTKNLNFFNTLSNKKEEFVPIDNNKIGIGVAAYDVSDIKKIMGKNSRDISKILGYEGRDEIIHKDDLVKISQ